MDDKSCLQHESFSLPQSDRSSVLLHGICFHAVSSARIVPLPPGEESASYLVTLGGKAVLTTKSPDLCRALSGNEVAKFH